MPRKKRTIVEETIPDAAEESTEFVDNIIVVTKVYKLNAGSRSFCFQTTEPVDELSIQAQYPTGGKFVVLEYNSLNNLLNTNHFEIEPKPSTALATNGDGDIRTRMLLDELAFTRNMMLQLIQGISNNKSATPLGEIASVMQTIHQMTPANNPTDLVLKGMELGMKANGGSPDWKTQLVETAKEVLPPIMQTFSAARQTQQVQPTMIQQAPAAAMMKQGIDWLKPKIIGGMNTDLAASWVIQNANDPLCQQLLSHAIRGDITTFIEIDPEIANEPYRSWFFNAIQQLKEWYAAQTTVENDSDGGTGDSADVATHAATGSGKPSIVKVS